jgi:hypothetical protein
VTAARPGGWPDLEPALWQRLALDDAGFDAMFAQYARGLGRRTFDDTAVRRALGYPWQRPEDGFALVDGEVVAPRDVGGARSPLLAFGSNGAPGALRTKLGHLPPGPDRDVLVEVLWLEGWDVAPAAHLTAYASLPATLVPSPGTAVRCAVLWVTPAQLTQLAWSEISYHLGRLAEPPLLAFAARFGAFVPPGHDGPVALEAVPARGRTLPAWTQEQALDAAAPLVLDRPARAADLVRAAYEDLGATAALVARRLRPHGRRLDDPRFTRALARGARR